jgi:hypothetical protein
MGTVPQSHEKRIRQTNRPQIAALLPAEPDFFSVFEPFPNRSPQIASLKIAPNLELAALSELQTPSYFHNNYANFLNTLFKVY